MANRSMIWRRLILILVGLWISQGQSAFAASAVFIGPNQLNDTQITDISTAGDSASVIVGRSPSLQLLFDQPFGVSRGDNVSIFTQPVRGGAAIGEVRFGFSDGNNVQFAGNRVFSSGSTVSLNNFSQRNCASLGGCNFIEILTRTTSRDVEGVQVDYIQINGEVVSVTAPTPEPHIWALMIIGFLGIAWRAKSLRYNNHPNLDVTPPPSSLLHSRSSQSLSFALASRPLYSRS